MRSVLDRVLMTSGWEMIFPLCSVMAGTIIGSDHAALILSSGEELKKRSSRFFFENAWLERPEFEDLVREKWSGLAGLGGPADNPITTWHRISAGLRQFLKGWGGQYWEGRPGSEGGYSRPDSRARRACRLSGPG